MSIGNRKTFWNLICDNDINKIVIPQIQRDYVQGRDNNKVEYARKTLLDDIKKAIETNETLDLNFVYGKNDEYSFIPVDGQQRLTTLFILHVYAFAKERLNDNLSILKEKFIYETRITTERFIELMIDNIAEFFNQNNCEDINLFIKDSSWYSNSWDRDPSIKSFLTVLKDINERFSKTENLAEILISRECPLTFMSLRIDDVGRISDLYIKMNSRGKPLTDFENFKSCLYDYIEKTKYSNKEDFISHMDNDWLSYIWDITDNPQKNCDNRFMLLIDTIIKNRLIPSGHIKDKNWNILFNNKGFYNFSYYEKYLDKEILLDLEKTFDFLLWYSSSSNNTFDTPNWLRKILCSNFNPDHAEKVKISAITKYARAVDKSNWDKEVFEKWFRVLNNLINNTYIDIDIKTERALKSVFEISDDYCKNPYQMFANDTYSISFFDEKQKSEEQLKCGLINSEPKWENEIIHAENNDYFRGEINFALLLCNINDKTSDIQKIDEFKSKWKIIELLFNISYPDHVIGDKNLFRRALLTFGDYKIDANSSYTYCFEEKKHYFDWRRMLREEKSFNVFKKLFDDLFSLSLSSKIDIENRLKECINNYNSVGNSFIYYLVKLPEVLDYMKEKRFREDSGNGNRKRIILYSSSTLQAQYTEAFTYFVCIKYNSNKVEYNYGQGLLTSDTSKAFISKVNGVDCHIEFDLERNYFYDENDKPYLNEYNQKIDNVDDMVKYMKEHF